MQATVIIRTEVGTYATSQNAAVTKRSAGIQRSWRKFPNGTKVSVVFGVSGQDATLTLENPAGLSSTGFDDLRRSLTIGTARPAAAFTIADETFSAEFELP